MTLSFDDPREVSDHEATFPDGIWLEQEGDYRLSLTAHPMETVLAQRYFVAVRASEDRK